MIDVWKLARNLVRRQQEIKKGCTCIGLPPREQRTSQSYNNRYLSMIKCPLHKDVRNPETRRYERPAMKHKINIRPQKNVIYMTAYAVMQAVYLGKDGQVGIKAYDSESGWRAVSTFPTMGDARAYLLDVLDTVKREQGLGIRTKRNLDPKYGGGLDFYITPCAIAVPKSPLLARGWQLQKLSTRAAIAVRRKLTHTINKGRIAKSRT